MIKKEKLEEKVSQTKIDKCEECQGKQALNYSRTEGPRIIYKFLCPIPGEHAYQKYNKELKEFQCHFSRPWLNY